MTTLNAALLNRRAALGALGAATLAGCGGGSGDNATAATGTTTGTTGNSSGCFLIPTETGGPYPLESVFNSSTDAYRRDITEGKSGVPLNLFLTIVNVNSSSCAPVANAEVYAWHCDKDGVYSGYSGQTGGVNAAGQTFCRGIQVTDSAGIAQFATIYPGWYNGRITHIHFRVFLSNGTAATSQLAFPQNITAAVYNSTLYAARGQNSSVTSFAADNVFSDGTTYQMASVIANSTTGGYDAYLTVGIAV